jgi:hypothetical protein
MTGEPPPATGLSEVCVPPAIPFGKKRVLGAIEVLARGGWGLPEVVSYSPTALTGVVTCADKFRVEGVLVCKPT